MGGNYRILDTEPMFDPVTSSERSEGSKNVLFNVVSNPFI